MDKFRWNPVFNLIIEIKNQYISNFGNINYETVTKTENGIKKDITCLENWILKLNNKQYTEIFSPVQVSQKDKIVLIRYGRYSDVFGGENEITNSNFWELNNGFYQECRSVVIDLEKEEIVLSPFKKFRNLNECPENQIDVIIDKINKAKCIEITNKLDGSMQSARKYYDKIIMSGSQSIDKNNSWRLKDGYNIIISQNIYIQMINHNSIYTFIFEYITLKDAHVVNYKKEDEGLYLLGMRNSYTGKQLSYNEVKKYADKYNVKMTEIFNKTFDEVMEDTKNYKSYEMEGYVLNIDGHLVKIKIDDYVHIHKILSNISSINLIIQHIADNTFDDLISKVPESYKQRVMKIANIIFNYIKQTNQDIDNYFNNAPKDSRKDFMIWIDKNVPDELVGYVKQKYLGQEYNVIKRMYGSQPKYKKLKEMGIDENYSAIFSNEE